MSSYILENTNICIEYMWIILKGKKLSSNQATKIDITYQSVRSSSSREGDWVKGGGIHIPPFFNRVHVNLMKGQSNKKYVFILVDHCTSQEPQLWRALQGRKQEHKKEGIIYTSSTYILYISFSIIQGLFVRKTIIYKWVSFLIVLEISSLQWNQIFFF